MDANATISKSEPAYLCRENSYIEPMPNASVPAPRGSRPDGYFEEWDTRRREEAPGEDWPPVP